MLSQSAKRQCPKEDGQATKSRETLPPYTNKFDYPASDIANIIF
jgi:hypothetical protein